MEVGIMRESPACALFDKDVLEAMIKAPLAGEDDKAAALMEAMIKAAVAGEGDKAAAVVESKANKLVSRIRATAEAAESAGLQRIKVTGDGKRMHLVSQQFIDKLKSRPRFRVPERMSNERLLRLARGDEAKFAILIKGYEAGEEIRDMEISILQQYHDKGYAYFEIADDADEA